MLPRLDAITVTPANRVDRPAALEGVADPRQEALSRSLQTMLGKTMQADVLSRLADGSYVVRIAGSAARMQLPAGVQVGSEVALKLVALEPRPTFEYSAEAGRSVAKVYAEPVAQSGARAPVARAEQALAAPAGQALANQAAPLAGRGPKLRPNSYAATLLSRAPLTPSDQLPALGADSEPATLSQTGRMITNLLSLAMQSQQPSTTLIGKTALLPSAVIEPARLATALHEAVGNSGLFYESHLGEWAAGARSLGALLREPQMQGALAPAPPPRAGQAEASIADPAMAQFISQQLATHEQGSIVWQGQLFPGQDLRWEIRRDGDGGGMRHDNSAPAESPWRSGLRLRFPLLGDIAATVVLAGDQLHIEVEAGGEVRDLLRAHAEALGAALAAAGSPLASLTVRATRMATDD